MKYAVSRRVRSPAGSVMAADSGIVIALIRGGPKFQWNLPTLRRRQKVIAVDALEETNLGDAGRQHSPHAW